MKTENEEYLEEIKNEKHQPRKLQLLQKYGLMAPQLTKEEQELCNQK
jgi:hypothetical protein